MDDFSTIAPVMSSTNFEIYDSDLTSANATNEPIDANSYIAPTWVYICAGLALVIIGTIGIATNGLALVVFIFDKTIRTPFNCLLLNMVIMELTCSIFGIPINAISSFRQGWKFGSSVCTAVAFAMSTAGVGCISLLSILGIHRCLIICMPHLSGKLNSWTSCLIILIASWVYTAAVVLPTLTDWAHFHPECLGISCGPAWDDPSNFSYTLYLLVMAFFIPVTVITSTSIILVFVMKKRSEQIQMASLKSSMAKKELKVTRMVIAMTLSFLMVWSPYAICAIIVLCGYSELLKNPFAILPVVFAKTSTFTNPIIYILMNSQFRNSFQKLMRRSNTKPPSSGMSTDDDELVGDNAKTEAMVMTIRKKCPSNV